MEPSPAPARGHPAPEPGAAAEGAPVGRVAGRPGGDLHSADRPGAGAPPAPGEPRRLLRWRERSRRPDDLSSLVDAARQGDRGALDELVRVTYQDAYTLAYRMTGNDDDARDVVQEAYLRAQRGLGRFRGDAQFTTWLYRITANCASSCLLKRRRSATEPLPEDAPVVETREERDPEWRAASGEERAVVAAALADLPPRLRRVIVLRDIYDLPHQAIAAELGISEAAAKVRLHRARRRLKERLVAERSTERPAVPAPGGPRDRGARRSGAGGR